MKCGALLLLVLCGVVESRITQLTVTDDSRHNIYLQTFGFETTGHIGLTFNSFALNPKPQSHSNVTVGMVLRDAKAYSNIRIANDQCLLLQEGVTQRDIKPATYDAWSGHHYSYAVKTAGLFNLFFSHCEDGTAVSFDLIVELYNTDSGGNKNYLSSGETSLPAWYFVLSVIFLAELIVWIYIIRKSKDFVRGIHKLMTVVVVFKVLNLFFEAFRCIVLAQTGVDHGAWFVLYYITSFIKGMLLFSVIILIGTGWSYMRPFLTDRDKRIILTLLILQILVNAAQVVVEEESPGEKSWFAWRDIFHIVDMVCWTAILFPILWSIRHLRNISHNDEKMLENLRRLQRFRRFYFVTMAYIYFTRMIMLIVGWNLSFHYQWVQTVANELAAAGFYATTGYLFKPSNPYVPLHQDDIDLHEFDDALSDGENEVGNLDRTANNF